MNPWTRFVRRTVVANLVLAVGIFGLPSRAASIEIAITGEVTSVSAPLTSVFSVGQSMSAAFTYDSDSPSAPSLIVTQRTFPNALTGGSFTIGSYSGSTVAGSINMANDDPTFNDRFRLNNVGVSAASIGFHDPYAFRILLEDSSRSAFNSLDLPLFLAGLGSFTDRSWSLSFTPIALVGDQTGVEGRLVSVTLIPASVPEPPTSMLLVLGTGLLSLNWMRREKREGVRLQYRKRLRTILISRQSRQPNGVTFPRRVSIVPSPLEYRQDIYRHVFVQQDAHSLSYSMVSAQ